MTIDTPPAYRDGFARAFGTTSGFAILGISLLALVMDRGCARSKYRTLPLRTCRPAPAPLPNLHSSRGPPTTICSATVCRRRGWRTFGAPTKILYWNLRTICQPRQRKPSRGLSKGWTRAWHSHDVSTGEAFARGFTESESSEAQDRDPDVPPKLDGVVDRVGDTRLNRPDGGCGGPASLAYGQLHGSPQLWDAIRE